ncbi:MAG: branched-chain amino acid aminotransferase [Clostridia bacterium]|nr:branched-chain amino acid aminotransferase [Clostridia bacterium]
MLIQKTTTPKAKPVDESALTFGKVFTDHMLMINYTEGKGWHDERIVPYQNLDMDPACMVLHYGQAIFEGMKAYKTADGRVQMFRPQDNINRMNKSGERLCIPALPVDKVVDCIKQLVEVEKDWIPTAPNTSLYIRPTIIATDVALGVHASKTYLFYVILSPVGPYYKEGLNPVKIFVEDEYVRAVRGGTGFTKCAGNYAASLIGSERAAKFGYSQVLWLDGVERKYVEEVGAMNMFFVIDNVLVTPPLEGSILGGITRDSVIKYARHKGLEVQERKIAIDEVMDAARSGHLNEAFGSGTAAVISPVGMLRMDDEEVVINNNEIGPIAQMLYDEITGIQYGRLSDPFGWVVEVK